jgi:hypothetical protein
MREPGRRTTRDLTAVLLALGVHALGLVVVARVVRPTLPRRVVDVDAVATVDVVVDDAMPGAPGGGLARQSEPADSLRGAAPLAHRGHVNGSELALAPLSPATPTAVPAPSAGAEPATSAAPGVASRPIDLGIGPDAWKQWLGPAGTHGAGVPRETAARAPLVRVAPASTTGGLLEGMEALDRGRAAGPAGPVVTALEQAAHGEGATAFGAARFAVTVLATGGVEVRLERASANEAEWKGVGARAAAALAKNAPRITPPRKGARFVVNLVAEMVMPNGQRLSELHGLRFQAVSPLPKSTSQGQKDMTDRNPTMASGVTPTQERRANAELPGVYVAERGKVCGYRFGLSALGPLLQGDCDLANVGAKPQRIVHGSVLEQELF